MGATARCSPHCPTCRVRGRKTLCSRSWLYLWRWSIGISPSTRGALRLHPHITMRSVSLLMAHVIAAIVVTRGDGSTRKSDVRLLCSTRDAQGQGTCKQVVPVGCKPTSDSPHDAGVPGRSPAPVPAMLLSSTGREARKSARRRWIQVSPNPHCSSKGLLLRGGSDSSRRDEIRASEEQQRVRNVLLYYPNLIGKAFEDEYRSSRRGRFSKMVLEIAPRVGQPFSV